jgi:HSP20 family protein
MNAHPLAINPQVGDFSNFMRQVQPFPDVLNLFQNPLKEWGDNMLSMKGMAKTLTPILSCDIVEQNKSFVVKVDLPGVKKDDLQLRISDQEIRISGERHSSIDEKTDYMHMLERQVGKVSRSLAVPRGADVNQVHASFNDGVLSIEIQKKEQANEEVMHKIKIHSVDIDSESSSSSSSSDAVSSEIKAKTDKKK